MGGNAPTQPTPVVTAPANIGPALNIQAENAEAQAALAERIYGLSERQEGVAEDQYSRWLNQFKDVELKVIDEADIGIDPTLIEGRARADQMQQMPSMMQEGRRSLAGRGISSDSPAQMALSSDIENTVGNQLGSAQTTARNQARSMSEAKRMGTFALGANVPQEVVQGYGTAAGIMGSAGQSMSQAAGQSASAAQQRAEGQRQSNMMLAAQQNRDMMNNYNQQLAAYQRNQMYGGTAGGLIGMYAGSVGGPIGMAVGSALGSFVGSELGGLF